MKKPFFTAITLSLFFIIAIWGLTAANAQGGIVPPAENGNYSLNDFISLALNVSRWLLGIVGSLTLVMFIYGGILLLVSGGSTEKIGQAKKTMVAAVIGLTIVLGSTLLVKTAMEYMGLSWDNSANKPKPISILHQSQS